MFPDEYQLKVFIFADVVRIWSWYQSDVDVIWVSLGAEIPGFINL